jgi:hypothetical protein
MYDHLNGNSDYPGRPEAMDDQDDDMPARGGAMEPRGGKMAPRAETKAMDAAAAKSFAELYGEPLSQGYSGNYGTLASDDAPPASSSRTDVETFHALFPEAEPVRYV